MSKQKVLQVHPKDNVLVALVNLPKNETVSFNGQSYILHDDIGAKHKFFIQDMQPGDAIIMYGVLVGKAQHAIRAGSRMTTENTKHAAEPYVFRPSHYQWQAPDISRFA
ncbi:MAG: UxaA family hydrolase, partial [Chitinophagaceae bacterium]|nr:UxaA family hydrolase [Chitinophagaceae bacterium]